MEFLIYINVLLNKLDLELVDSITLYLAKIKCDMIKQKESEISQIQFFLFLFIYLFIYFLSIVYIISKLPFTTDPIETGQLVPKIRAV